MEARRFVVLRHEPGESGPRELHWDLMLEFGDRLRTWALSREPLAGVPIAAEESPAHRSAYLDYEGPVSRGRGTVSRFDRGTFELEAESADEITATLAGRRLKGYLRLHRDASSQRWTVLLAPN
ncbi:MAG: hypothetical protein H6821_15210 [Planctomycetaceae bacterium]|nr:hypothetical protein [Planctomycetaceae bacterium]